MEQPTKEQRQRIFEWTGIYTKGHVIPTWNIINAFQYVIPKLQNEGYQIDIQCLEHKDYRVLIYKIATDVLVAKVADDDLGLALFGAIWEVVK